ncbi:MAG TPA: endolytic transglycosylase MltG [Pyrinomonadaceae bacterium]
MRAFIIILTLLILSAALFSAWAYKELKTAREHTHANQYLEIKRGTNPEEVINTLTNAGVIRRGWLFKLYVRLSGSGPRLKAGEYRFASPIAPVEVLRKLEEGEQRLSRLTVIEGWTRWDIAAQMARLPELKLQSPEEALALMNEVSLIADIDPIASNLEGYLYPETYSYPPDTSARDVIALMVSRFRQVWEGRFSEVARSSGRSPREIVTVASLVETEAKLNEERPLVASVIYNRLRLNMALGIDSTVIYASKLAGKWRNDGKVYQSDLDRDSPYNTRKVVGLPPGPLASPGALSIEAALSPAATDYLYYVREPSRNDGAHNFYATESDFQRGVQRLREWERTRDAQANTNTAATPQ